MPRTQHRLFDVPTANRLVDLRDYADEHGLTLNLDLNTKREPKVHWVIQIHDDEDRTCISAHGRELREVVRTLHDKLMKKFPKVLE